MMKIIIKTIVMIIMIIINWSNMMTIIITANPDDIPVTHTYLQDSGEESDTASTLEVKKKRPLEMLWKLFFWKLLYAMSH